MALTEKQICFCNEYLIDLNATQAAIRAGYSEKSARQIAQRMLTKDDIQEYLQKIMNDKQSNLIASQSEVLETLTAVMRRQQKEQIVTSERHRRSYFDEEGRKVTEDT